MVIELKKEDLLWLEKNHPNLTLEGKILNGQVKSYREYNKVAIKSKYSLEINFQAKQGSILPQVKEIEGKIKKIAEELELPILDLHINNDETICLCIYEKEKDYFPNNFSIKIFFEELLEPYLYWVTFYQKYKKPPWEGYAHFDLGYLELYAENNISIENLKKRISSEKLLTYKRYKGHHDCLCGSKKKLKKCHELLYTSVYKLKNELYG